MEKGEQQNNLLHKYKKLNELTNGEFFNCQKELIEINAEIEMLKERKNVLETAIQEIINGKKLLNDN